MKLPLVLTAIIVAISALWGVREHRTLTVLRLQHQAALREAAELGVSSDTTKPFTATKVTRRLREDDARKVKEFADSLVAFAHEMKQTEETGDPPDEGMKKRTFELIDGMLSLTGAELKLLVAELRTRTDMDDEMRKHMIGFSIMMLAQQHPRMAIALFTESSDLMKDNPMGDHVVSSALTQWAKDEPLAALEWIKQNATKHPDLVKDDAKRAVIIGAAQQDFGLAFQLAGEIKFEGGDESLMDTLADSANTPERQAEFLAALRKHAAGITDAKAREKFQTSGVREMFSEVTESGFDRSMKWLETAELSESESAGLLGSIDYHATKKETGKWLDWIASQPGNANQREESTRDLVRQWTGNDYRAAGEWLANSPAGPTKDAAVMSYVETVAPYDPEIATQWANTLPAEKRGNALKEIEQRKPKSE
jgi:hypothetical protein